MPLFEPESLASESNVWVNFPWPLSDFASDKLYGYINNLNLSAVFCKHIQADVWECMKKEEKYGSTKPELASIS